MACPWVEVRALWPRLAEAPCGATHALEENVVGLGDPGHTVDQRPDTALDVGYLVEKADMSFMCALRQTRADPNNVRLWIGLAFRRHDDALEIVLHRLCKDLGQKPIWLGHLAAK